jgi:predicted transcriptional regulator
MTEVKESPLKVGDTFPTKERLLLRIVEEANLYGFRMAIKRSDTVEVDARELNRETLSFAKVVNLIYLV